MPFGGLLPYGDEDGGFDILSQLGMGGGGPEAMRGGTPSAAMPQQGGGGGGFMEQLAALMPQLMTAFGAGQAIRQRNPVALSGIVENFSQGQEARRRGRLAEEAQRLREEREGRLAEFAQKKYDQDVVESKARTAATERDDTRQGSTALQNMIGNIEDNARQTFTSRPPQGAGLEEYISQQANRVGTMEGGDPDAVRAMLMGLATLLSQAEPEKPFIMADPDNPPTSVPGNAIVRTKPRTPQGPQPRSPIRRREQKDGVTYEYLIDPQSLKELPNTRTTVGEADPIEKIIREAGGGGTGAPVASPAAAAPKAPPQLKERRVVEGKLAEWDGKGWKAVR